MYAFKPVLQSNDTKSVKMHDLYKLTTYLHLFRPSKGGTLWLLDFLSAKNMFLDKPTDNLTRTSQQ